MATQDTAEQPPDDGVEAMIDRMIREYHANYQETSQPDDQDSITERSDSYVSVGDVLKDEGTVTMTGNERGVLQGFLTAFQSQSVLSSEANMTLQGVESTEDIEGNRYLTFHLFIYKTIPDGNDSNMPRQPGLFLHKFDNSEDTIKNLMRHLGEWDQIILSDALGTTGGQEYIADHLAEAYRRTQTVIHDDHGFEVDLGDGMLNCPLGSIMEAAGIRVPSDTEDPSESSAADAGGTAEVW